MQVVIEIVGSPTGSGGQQLQFIIPLENISNVSWDQVNAQANLILTNGTDIVISEDFYNKLKRELKNSSATKYIEIES